MITITDKAATEINRIIKEEGAEDVLFRLAIKGGGCSGYQYKLDLVPNAENTDHVFESNGVKIAIDKRSALYAEGTVVDFIEDLTKRGFTCKNPAATGTCGCGSSFSL